MNLLFKLSYLNSNFALTPGYLYPALNNPALICWIFQWSKTVLILIKLLLLLLLLLLFLAHSLGTRYVTVSPNQLSFRNVRTAVKCGYAKQCIVWELKKEVCPQLSLCWCPNFLHLGNGSVFKFWSGYLNWNGWDPTSLGSLSIDDGDASENVTFKMNSPFFKFVALIPIRWKCQM